MTYKTHGIALTESAKPCKQRHPVRATNTTVEIDEAYIGGRLRLKGSKVAKASKPL